MTKLQELLIQKISSTKDEKILEEVNRLLEAGFSDEVYILNQEQKTAIKESREQIKQGKYLDDDVANQQAKEWLKRK